MIMPRRVFAIAAVISVLFVSTACAQKLYWADQGADKIQRSDLDGSNVEDIVLGSFSGRVTGIALDIAGGKVYWTELDGNMIRRANLDGTGIENLVTTDVTFVNELANTIAPGACREAQYVKFLTLRQGSTITLDNVRVYYRTLTREPNVTVNELGCGALVRSGPALFCPPSSPAALVQILDSPGGDPVGLVGNRMIGLDAGDPGMAQKIQVRFDALPPPFDVWDGTELWVLEPQDLCVLSGVGPFDGCPAGVDSFKVAELTCDVTLAFATDWTTVGTFHVQHPGIVPDGQYVVQVMEEGCEPTDPSSFSAALMVTNSKYGDIVGGLDPGAGVWTAPDGNTDIAPDALAAISAFSNATVNPTKLRADLEPCALDGKVNISDIVQILGGFSNLPYPFGPTTLDANGNPVCPSPDPCG